MPQPIVLFDNARRARRVRWLVLASAALAIACLYWAADLLRNYGLAPGDGGALRPAGERQMMALLVASLGVTPFLGLIYYAGLYVARIELRPPLLHLWTLGPRQQQFDPGQVSSVTFRDWAIEPGSPVSTPWLTLRITGRRAPFLLDLAADHVDRRAIEKLGRRTAGSDPC